MRIHRNGGGRRFEGKAGAGARTQFGHNRRSCFWGARAAIWGKAGRRGGTKLPGRAELSKNNNNGWCFLEAVGWNCCKGWFDWEGYFFLEGFFFKGL